MTHKEACIEGLRSAWRLWRPIYIHLGIHMMITIGIVLSLLWLSLPFWLINLNE